MTVTEDSSLGLTLILTSTDSSLSDVKLFQSLRMWCEAPGFATQVVLAAVSAVSAIAVKWSASQKESSLSISPIVAIAASASLFCLFGFGRFPLPFCFPCRAPSARIRCLHLALPLCSAVAADLFQFPTVVIVPSVASCASAVPLLPLPRPPLW